MIRETNRAERERESVRMCVCFRQRLEGNEGGCGAAGLALTGRAGLVYNGSVIRGRG